jgi:hypothetical protein
MRGRASATFRNSEGFCLLVKTRRLYGTSVARRVELTRSKLLSGTVAPGALLPHRSERERQESAGEDALAKPSGGARYLREGDGRSRLADLTGRSRERREWERQRSLPLRAVSALSGH